MTFLSVLLFAATVATGRPAPDALKAAFDLRRAQLGLSLQAWRALPYPASGPDAAKIKPICSNDAGAAVSGLQLTADQNGVVVCAYASRYGHYFLPEPIDLVPNYPTRRLRYVFRDDRLVRIEFHLNSNAYDPLIADLDARYGPAAKSTQDTAQARLGQYRRVSQTWATGGSTIEIVDPVPPAYDLGLSFVLAASARKAG